MTGSGTGAKIRLFVRTKGLRNCVERRQIEGLGSESTEDRPRREDDVDPRAERRTGR